MLPAYFDCSDNLQQYKLQIFTDLLKWLSIFLGMLNREISVYYLIYFRKLYFPDF